MRCLSLAPMGNVGKSNKCVRRDNCKENYRSMMTLDIVLVERKRL